MSGLLTEVPRCDVCGSTDAVHLFTARDRVHGVPGEFGVVRCARCATVRLSPRPTPEELGRYYPETYQPYADAPAPRRRSRALTWLRDALRGSALRALGYPGRPRRLDRLVAHSATLTRFGAYRSPGFPRWRPGARALDVGCGPGHFLALLRQHGWDVTGLDFSPTAAAAAARQGLDVRVGELGTDGLQEGSFAFVHMRHVIEHVASPREALTRVRELMEPGGAVYIETPNVASAGFRRYGPLWYPLEAPRHLWLFTPDTLSDLARECGLEVISVRTSTYIAPRWAAAFRAADAAGHPARDTPALRRRDIPRVAFETLADRVELARNRGSGDILGLWARKPSD